MTALAFVCAIPAALVAQPPSDQWLTRPVDDRTFAAFKSFYTYDRSLPLETQVVRDTSTAMLVMNVSYQSTPGIRVTGRTYSTAASTSQRRPAVIILHGGGAPGKDAAGVRFAADYLARAGFLVLAIDMQFFGERARADVLTSFTEAEKHDKLYNQPAAYLAWVMQTIKDVGRGYDWLVKERDADPRRVALVGFSRGAILANIVGGADQRIAAVALVLGGHFDALERVHEAAACPANYIGRIAPRPLFMLNGRNDADMFRDESVLPLQKHAKEPKELVWLETGHSVPREEFPRLATWLQGKLK